MADNKPESKVDIQLLQNGIKDLTECLICTDMFCNPKILPCFHTFCLKCIEQYGKDKTVGDSISCPICRKECIIPKGGLPKLSTNFTIEQLITVQSESGLNKFHIPDCDVCLNGKQHRVVATTLCLDCEENMCDQCSNIHRSMKMSMAHQLAPVWESTKVRFGEHFCEKHLKEKIKIFCRDCKKLICLLCSVTMHNKHDCYGIEETAEEYKKSFRDYRDGVNKHLSVFKSRYNDIDAKFANFMMTIDDVEKSIILEKKRKAIEYLANRHARNLQEKLVSRKSHIQDHVNKTREDIQGSMTICESFVEYCQKAIDESDAVENIRIADGLRVRAEEITAQGLPTSLDNLPSLKFFSSDLTDTRNYIGTIYDECRLSNSVRGITIMKKELYIVLWESRNIDVYDVDTFTYQQAIPVKGLNAAFDMVAHENVVYVSEYQVGLIHRIHLPEETYSNWDVNSKCPTMSINKAGNIVVACRSLNKIVEYTSFGTVVREISVNDVVRTDRCLNHAIQLDNDQFLICHTSATDHDVCIIDANGKSVRSYRKEKGQGINQLYFPMYLAVDQSGFILVADADNNRIIQLNASLEYMREIIPKSAGLRKPRRVYLNELTGHLYISENAEKNIKIFDTEIL